MSRARQHPTNLPRELSTFVGRHETLSEIRSAFAGGARLVTVLGAPGTGKTRVARRYGAEHAASSGPVIFFDLASARSLTDIVAAVASVLDVPLQANQSDAAMQLGRALAARGRSLFIFDNFEQLVASARASLGVWLEMAPEGLFLATSRELLGIEGEERVVLSSLAEDEALELFFSRAKQAGRRADIMDADRILARRIVTGLDGIPLAIELAASRASMLSLSQLADRLEQGLGWLKSDRRDRSPRHSTLRDAVAWSWSLLDDDEKAALAQCASFEHGFSLEAAEAVVRLEGDRSVLDTLQSLRNKSLLRANDESDAPRFDLYETVRDFARSEARPEQAGETRARHAAFFLARGKDWARGAHGARGAEHRATLALERENLIAAHATLLESSAAEATEMIAILEPLFSTRGPLDAFARLVEATRETAEKSGDSRSVARLFRVHAEIDRQRGRALDARRDSALALDLAREARDAALEAQVLGLLGIVEWQLRAIDDAEAHTRAARDLNAKLANRRVEGMCIGQLGVIAGFRRRFDEARTLLEQARAIERAEGDVHNEAIATYFLASTIFDQGDIDRAKRSYEDALRVLRLADNRRYEGIALYMLALVELELEHLGEAHAHLNDALRTLRELGDQRLEAVVVTGLGHHALARRDPDEAIARYEESTALLQQVGGDPRYEGLALACAGAAAAILGREEDAKIALSSARALLSGIHDEVAVSVVQVLEGFVMLASAGAAHARGDGDRAATLRREAGERASSGSRGAALERLAARFLRHEIDAGSPAAGARAPETAGRLEVGPGAEWFRRGAGERVDLTRRPKLRMLLEALVEKRLASPGNPAQAEWLVSRVWPQEKILPSAASSRLYVAVATLRKLGMGDVIVTRGEGYLLHPAIDLSSI